MSDNNEFCTVELKVRVAAAPMSFALDCELVEFDLNVELPLFEDPELTRIDVLEEIAATDDIIESLC